MENKQDLLQILKEIDPAILSYQEWINVGMALKHEGYDASDWDQWSAKDKARHKAGECFRKWNTFQGAFGSPVTGGTIVQLAMYQGWKPATSDRGLGIALSWDDIIGEKDDLKIIDQHWVEGVDITEPSDRNWDPAGDLIKYLETLFDANDHVGYVTKSFERDGRFLPGKGHADRTAGQLIEALSKCNGDIGAVLGDYKPEVGAWIRFNPLDGQGIKDANVTDYRFALVESDAVDIEKQNAIIRELELPVACLVHSGNKSIHAIVKIEATDYTEYRKRVDYLYNVCQKNGLRIDTQNRNPSRLSRMPGIVRDGRKQFLIDINIGKESWHEWHEWIEGVNDDLPDPESLSDVWDNLPPLAPPLISGVLRQGHKMLLAGPSKAGKSYSLIGLSIGIAEGRTWLGWDCAKGRVLYVNLELDRASCLHRFRDVYEALGWPPANVNNIDIWNLRGKAVPMDKLAPKLIRRAQKREYIAVIIDPIYKVITGDENSAAEMANFTNQFDKVCTELGSAVIYCHHHSKGFQGQKRSMDRASGSGVFARDPDVLLDLVELEIPDDLRAIQVNKAVAEAISDFIFIKNPDYKKISGGDLESEKQMRLHIPEALTKLQTKELEERIKNVKKNMDMRSAWRIEGTLREFPKFAPLDIYFDYPIHTIDTDGALKNLMPEFEKAPWQKALDSRKTPEERKKDRVSEIEIAFAAFELKGAEEITLGDLAEGMGVSKETVKRRIKEHKGFKTVVEPGKETLVIRK